jgi:thioredoxin reductase (NADPH)
MSDVFDVLIIGAGPAGLAAAIAAKARGLSYVVLEKGALVNSLLHYPSDMVFATTPELMEIGELPFVSPHEKPSRLEALRYYRRTTDRFALDVRLGERVDGLAHAPHGGFQVVSATSTGRTCRTTIARPTRTTGSASSSSAARIRRLRPRSICTAQAPPR